MQLAAFNDAVRLNGRQLGVITFAAATDMGVQVGLINIIKSTQA